MINQAMECLLTSLPRLDFISRLIKCLQIVRVCFRSATTITWDEVLKIQVIV